MGGLISSIKKLFGNELLRNKFGLTYSIITYWSLTNQALKFRNKSTKKTHLNFLNKTNITNNSVKQKFRLLAWKSS